MPTTFSSLAPEVFRQIACEATGLDVEGPPTAISTLRLTCRDFDANLDQDNVGDLYSVIFHQKFDPPIGITLVEFVANVCHELERRFWALNIFKQGNIDVEGLDDVLWIAYHMVEHSALRERNIRQLNHANAFPFLIKYLLRWLPPANAEDPMCWPRLTEREGLALAISWYLASSANVEALSAETRKQLQSLLVPVVYATFRYPISHLHACRFDAASRGEPRHHVEVNYFGSIKRGVQRPSGPTFATLLNAVLQSSHIVTWHPLMWRQSFADWRAIDRAALQTLGPVRAGDPRLRHSPPYRVGSLTGKWAGNSAIPSIPRYSAWMESNAFQPDAGFYDEITSKLWNFEFKEYYCFSGIPIVPVDLEENGHENAWISPRVTSGTEEGIDRLEATYLTRYHRYKPGSVLDHSAVADVVVIGRTFGMHTDNDCRLLGRVRLADGCFVIRLYRPFGGQLVLRGYVTSSGHLIAKAGRPVQTNPGPDFEEVVHIVNLARSDTVTGLQDRD